MGVLINYKSCASTLVPWDRHKVRNCPVTQAPGLLRGTAEQQAASRSSRGPATPQALGSAQDGVVETLGVLVPAGMWLCLVRARAGPQVGVCPHRGRVEELSRADGGFVQHLCPCMPEMNWISRGGMRIGEQGSPH